MQPAYARNAALCSMQAACIRSVNPAVSKPNNAMVVSQCVSRCKLCHVMCRFPVPLEITGGKRRRSSPDTCPVIRRTS